MTTAEKEYAGILERNEMDTLEYTKKKSYLLLDTPKSCKECPFICYYSDIRAYCHAVYSNHDKFRELDDINCVDNKCPLVELPVSMVYAYTEHSKGYNLYRRFVIDKALKKKRGY